MKRVFTAALFAVIMIMTVTLFSVAATADSDVLQLPEDDKTGYPVTGISGDDYKKDVYASKVVVPENIIRLGKEIFAGCSNLKRIMLHDKIQVIGEKAFDGTAYYDDIENWDNGVLYIGDALIKADAEKIGESYNIKKGTRIIADGAFKDCKRLKSIVIPDTVEYVGTDSFAGTAFFKNENNWSDNMLVIDRVLIAVNLEYSGVFTVPDGIVTVADGAFKNSKISELITPDSLKFIGDNALYGCENLTSVYIGKSVKTIGRGPFRNCTKLSEITVCEQNENFLTVDGVLYNKRLSAVIRCPQRLLGDVFVAHTVTRIDAYAFEQCSEIKSIQMPKGCVFIGDSAFSRCENLTDIKLPEGVEYIDKYAFSYCNSIQSVKVPDNVNYLGKYAYSFCNNLKEVSVGNKVTHIKEGLFEGCEKLSTIDLGQYVEQIEKSAFASTKYITDVSKYKNGLLIASDKYLIKTTHDLTVCDIPEGITLIAEGAFERLSDSVYLKRIYMPTSVKKLNGQAFADINKKIPVYYAGKWDELAYTDFDCGSINLHTSDFKTVIYSVVIPGIILTLFTVGIVAFDYIKKQYEQEMGEEYAKE